MRFSPGRWIQQSLQRLILLSPCKSSAKNAPRDALEVSLSHHRLAKTRKPKILKV